MPLFHSPPPHPRRPRRPAAPSVSPAPRAEPLESRVLLAVFTVRTTADFGSGSLRAAITDASTTPFAPHQIRFDIPGAGVHTISPRAPLPPVNFNAVIDATTQPGYAGSPLVEIDGSLAGPGVDGLTLGSSAVFPTSNAVVTVRGLAINGFSGNGIADYAWQAQFEANYIGLTPTGDVARPNGGAGILVTSSGTTIGGALPAQRNIISGNAGAGVRVSPINQSWPRATIQGNWIGTDVTGAKALGNGAEGIVAEGNVNRAVNDVTIGGRAAGEGNVISGNGASGIRLAFITFIPEILGNRIGTDVSGTRPLGNGASPAARWRDGITAVEGRVSFGPDIGGPGVGYGNLISANAGSGVRSTFAVRLVGNHIGTDAGGNAALANGGDGVTLDATAANGIAHLTGNLISGNRGDGVNAVGDNRFSFVQLQGNYIGTSAAGTAALGNGGDGVDLSATFTSGLGHSFNPAASPPVLDPGADGRNVISGNAGHGLRLGSLPPTGGQSVDENYIGTDVTGMAPLGNGGSGVYITAPGWRLGYPFGRSVISANGGDGVTVVGAAGASVTATTIGRAMIGTDAQGGGAGRMGNAGSGVAVIDSSGMTVGGFDAGDDVAVNTIAYNGRGGIVVTGAASKMIRASANKVFSNAGVEIDLGGDGITPNDSADADAGPNGLQNFPIINEADAAASAGVSLPLRTRVRFELHSEPLKTYTLVFVAAAEPDAGGRGAAERILGQVRVTTDAAGDASGTALVGPAFVGEAVSATATDPDMNTSEFGDAVRATPAEVTGRFVFYNGSTRDGGDPAADPRDDAAIALDKYPLGGPGEPTTFASVTSYPKGINGVMIDLRNVPVGATLTADDFILQAGSGAPGSVWTQGPQPSSVTLRRGAGVAGSNRATLVWDDTMAVKNGWLQVTVKATPSTGLSRPDVFYFGNLVGSVGEDRTPLTVDNADLAALRRRLGRPPTGTDRAYDLDHDGATNVRDLAIARSNFGRTLSPLSAAPPQPPPTVLPASTLLDESHRPTRRRRYDS